MKDLHDKVSLTTRRGLVVHSDDRHSSFSITHRQTKRRSSFRGNPLKPHNKVEPLVLLAASKIGTFVIVGGVAE